MISHKDLANAVRFLSIDSIQKAKSGHPGITMGFSDAATVLFSKVLRFCAKQPKWPIRDRFVLSAGHGAPLLYSLLYLTGYEDASLEDLKNLRQLHSKMAGHPEYGLLAGIETTTGPLGQGLATAVGLALAERMQHARFGNLIDHYTYVAVGDGCLMEGISQEAIALAGHLKLNKLIVLWDNNGITIDGGVSLACETDQIMRFKASGWNTLEVDGHNEEEILSALLQAKESPKPTLISCKTVIAKGAPTKEGKASSHGSPLGEEEIKGVREYYNWPHEAFDIPQDILSAWRAAGEKGETLVRAWEKELSALPEKERLLFINELENNKFPTDWEQSFKEYKTSLLSQPEPVATRKASQNALEVLVPLMPYLIGGSADLSPANLTKTKASVDLTSDYKGNYIHYGIREHAMAAAMNGLSLEGGFIPYGGTFLAFLDYLKPALRLSALMKRQVIYVLTHDSIGVGEDGPTHQPIEQLASVRAMPQILVMRPADSVETAECWEIALKTNDRPSVLALSRQALPLLRKTADENLCLKGGYVISAATKKDETTGQTADERQLTLIATGSEVSLAVQVQGLLKEKGVLAAVVSMPCLELFDRQQETYKKAVLGNKPRFFIEALSPFGLEKYTGENGKVFGMESFGASAPAGKLMDYFGFTPEKIMEKVLQHLEKQV